MFCSYVRLPLKVGHPGCGTSLVLNILELVPHKLAIITMLMRDRAQWCTSCHNGWRKYGRKCHVPLARTWR